MDGNRILLVEDNADDEALMLDAFDRCGLNARVDVARDGAEALEILLHTPLQDEELPRLVLLDLRLPKVAGLDVIRRLRVEARTRYLPIVVLTSSSQQEDIRNSYVNGANAYVRKPIDFEQFLDVVRAINSFWLKANETV